MRAASRTALFPAAGPAVALALALGLAAAGVTRPGDVTPLGDAQPFAPGIASTRWSDVRLTISPDGQTALWFSRDRPGGAGGYDIWMSRRHAGVWQDATPAPFNSAARDFDPAFTANGRYVYFSSSRPGSFGGDDIYRVRVTGTIFAVPEHLGHEINTAGDEWAPMVSGDNQWLLFSSNGHAGARRLDLFVAKARGDGFEPAVPVPGLINTDADEFDATFLADGERIVFTRARDIAVDPVRLYHAAPRAGVYEEATLLSDVVNTPASDTYAPMLDWSDRCRLTFTTRRPATSENGVDVYVVRYC